MFKKFMCFLLALQFVSLPAGADPQKGIPFLVVQNYVTQMNLTTGKQTLGEFYKAMQGKLPVAIDREFRVLADRYGQQKLPPIEKLVRQDGKRKLIQFTMKPTGQARYVIEWREGDEHFTYRERGTFKKSITHRIAFADLAKPYEVMQKMTGDRALLTEKAPTVQFLAAEEVKRLTPEQRRRYIDRVRGVLESAEKVQNEMARTTAFYPHWFLPSAIAAITPEGTCVAAGWVGSYQNNSCRPPDESFGANGCVKCNPEIYGSSPPCLGSQQKLPLDATSQCNRQTDNRKYQVFQGVKTDAEVNAKKQALSAHITRLREACVGIEQEASKKLADQPPTCTELGLRLSELDQVTCDILKTQPEGFAELTCALSGGGGAKDEPVVEPQPPVPPVAADPPGTEGVSDPDCASLPQVASALGCQESERRQMQCQKDGAGFAAFYCECAGDRNGSASGTIRHTVCEAAKSNDASDRLRERRRTKKEESWFQPWMGGALMLGALMFGAYYFHKQQIKREADKLAPVPTNPVPVDTSPIAPTPTDTDRNTPAGIR